MLVVIEYSRTALNSIQPDDFFVTSGLSYYAAIICTSAGTKRR